MSAPRPFRTGFTLIELLVVLAIVALLAGVLFPVFAQARAKARQTQCLSSERQIGLALQQYAQDNDQRFPNGLILGDGRPFWAGQGWAGQCLPYLQNPAVLRCPDDPTPAHGDHDQTVSYGYNINLVEGKTHGFITDTLPPGRGLAALNAPARTVALFEVSGVTTDLAQPQEGSLPGGLLGTNLSASSSGLDNRLYAQKTVATSPDNQYATGSLGGRPSVQPSQFRSPRGRHGGGSNFLLADGHVRWLAGGAVSSGLNAAAPECAQDDSPHRPGCAPAPETLTASGTDALSPNSQATFSAN